MKVADAAALQLPWWARDGGQVRFECTGCGKCCQNEGEVWLNVDEFVDITRHLETNHSTFLDIYAAEVRTDWVRLKEKSSTSSALGSTSSVNVDSCIFLGDDGKTCSIYKHRPVQCKTYPYWPSLLASPEKWADEAATKEKEWTPAGGGCEGISLASQLSQPSPPVAVSADTIHRNSLLDTMYHDAFPFMGSGDDVKRLLARAGAIDRLVRATSAWVQDFVLKYRLCPFADEVFKQDSIRYRVFLRSEPDRILDKLKYEMLALLTEREDAVETTLLVLPFAFPDFQEFYEWSVKVEDELLPRLEDSTRSSFAPLAPSLSEEQEGGPEIQLAFFHPSFGWAGEDEDAPINYEKRAPFPTINLLRARRVREYASQGKTRTIADSNQQSLAAAGGPALKKEFEDIIRLAL